MASDVKAASLSKYNQDRTWLNASLGGPLWTNKLFFYGSYYRPGRNRQNVANVYGSLPDYESTRNEGFVKLTFQPISQILVNGTYRYSHRLDTGSRLRLDLRPIDRPRRRVVAEDRHPDGSWVINGRSFASFKWTHFANPGSTPPRQRVDGGDQHEPRHAVAGDRARQGRLPERARHHRRAGRLQHVRPAADQPVRLYVERRQDGRRLQSATTTSYDHDDFYRTAWQVAYNLTLGSDVPARHPRRLPVLRRLGGPAAVLERLGHDHGAGRPLRPTWASPVYYLATFQQQTIGAVPADSPPSTSRSERRDERHDQLEEPGRSTPACC